MNDSKYRSKISSYFQPYLEIAQRFGAGCIVGSVTWRANADWGDRLGYSKQSLADINRSAIDLCCEIRSRASGTSERPIVISACLGPRGDGYASGSKMAPDEAQGYHEVQIGTFVGTPADFVTAASLNDVDEAIGIARAAKAVGMPVVESFTLGSDGNLPNGQTLEAAINQVDVACDGYVSYYGINCAHVSHFEHLLVEAKPWSKRLRAIRANASKRSHAELDGSPQLDFGNPKEFGDDYRRLKEVAQQLNILGGCCGTDHRHLEQVAMACLEKVSE